MSLVLYSTLGCHLCEEAEELLLQAGVQDWQVVEISESNELVERYGMVIPVLARNFNADIGAELNWPFDLKQLMSWLDKK